MSEKSNIVGIHGTDVKFIPGVPRHDIATMLRGLADRAERGEIDALALSYSVVNAGMGTAVSTPENAYYSMLGTLEELKDLIKERAPKDRNNIEYENG